MIFKKTLLVLTLIAIYAIAEASASGIDIQKQLAKKQGYKKKPTLLQDTTSTIEAVPAQGESIVMTTSSEEQPTSLVDEQFGGLIEQEKYDKIEKLGESMSDEDFLKQLCLLIVSFAHYKGLYGCLKRRKMVSGYFVHGRMEVVKEAIAMIWSEDARYYIKGGDLEVAVSLALKQDYHDRVIDLFVVRQERTEDEEEQPKQKRWIASFGWFMYMFFDNLAPWEDSKSLKRFMTLKGEELNGKYPAVYEIFCQRLVECLRFRLSDPNGKRLMVDLVAQPALLTLAAFVEGFLWRAGDNDRANLVKYSWREAVQEGLKKEYPSGGEKLWNAIMDKYLGEFPIDYPPSAGVLDAVLKKFPTKQQLEGEWLATNFPGFLDKVNEEVTALVPTVLVGIIVEYARPTWLDVE